MRRDFRPRQAAPPPVATGPAAVIRICLRMVRNLFVHGRPFPPPFVFKEPQE